MILESGDTHAMQESYFVRLLKISSQFFYFVVIIYLTIYFVSAFQNAGATDDKLLIIKNNWPILFIILFPVLISVYIAIPHNVITLFLDFCNAAGISIPSLVIILIFIPIFAYYVFGTIETDKKNTIEKILTGLAGLFTGGFAQKKFGISSDKTASKED